MSDDTLNDTWQQFDYFPSSVYILEKPEFLESVKKVSDSYLKVAQKEQKKLNELYPVRMTANYYDDPAIEDFRNYVLATSWNILNSQGYAMNMFNTQFTEMWTQEHFKHSAMSQHVHGYGSQIIAFYFLDCPKDCSRVVFHDPRAGKVINDLPEAQVELATSASRMINFEPKPGLLMFTNAYVAHEFTRHGSTKPIRFIHMNITVGQAQSFCQAPAEII
jgi:hypothetical protein